MARYSPIKNSCVAGELTPRLEGRDDLDQYFQGLRQAHNGVVLPHGGFSERSGSMFVAEVKDSTKLTVLLKFQFSTDAAYVLEAGNLYFRFYTNEGRLEDPVDTPVEVVTPYLEAELRDIQFIQEADVMWVVHPDHETYKLSRTSATTFSFVPVVWREGRAPMRASNLEATTVTVTGAGPYTLTASAALWVTVAAGPPDDVGRMVRVKAASDEQWYEISAVSSDTVATADKRSTGTDPAGATTDWSRGMFSDNEGARATTFHDSRLAYGGAQFAGTQDKYVLSDSDDFDRFGNDATLDDNSIARRTTSGEVNQIQWMVSADEELNIGTAGAEFRARGANEDLLTPSGTVTKSKTSRGSAHVRAVKLDNQVIFVQRNSRKIRELKFDIGADSLTARDISILAEHLFNQGIHEMHYQQDPDSVLWFVRKDGVLVGLTFEDEQKVIGGHRHTFGGSFDGGTAVCESAAVIPDPNEVEDQLWVVVKRTIDGATKRYVEFVQEQFKPDITVTSTDAERIEAMDEAWFVDSGLELNDLSTITNITQADPGVVTTSAAHGFSNGDQVRTIKVKGMTEVNLEASLVANVTSTTFELQDLAGVNLDTTGFTAYSSGGEVRKMVFSVSGADHLEGEVVQVFVDGAVHSDKTVVSGVVTLDRLASRVLVGEGFTYQGETQRFTGGGEIGSDQGQQTKIQRVVLRVHNTLGGEVGVGSAPALLEPFLYRDGDDPMDQSPPLFSGDKEVPVEGGWTDTPTVFWRQVQPLPMTVLAVLPRMESGER